MYWYRFKTSFSGENSIAIGYNVSSSANEATIGNNNITDIHMNQDGKAKVHCGKLNLNLIYKQVLMD